MANRVFITTNGAYIVAEEITKKSGIWIVRNPAVVDVHPSQVSFVFTPLRFIEPGADVEFQASAFLCSQALAESIDAQYKKHLAELERKKK